jgi:hypothetical protein
MEKLERLLSSNLSSVEIAEGSGVSFNLIEGVRNNKLPLRHLLLEDALKLMSYINETAPERVYKGYKPKYKKLFKFIFDNEETGITTPLCILDSNYELTVEDALEIMEIDDIDDYFDPDWGWKGFKYEYLKIVEMESLEN